MKRHDEEMDIPIFGGNGQEDITCDGNGGWYDYKNKPIKQIKCIINDGLLLSVRKLQDDVNLKIGSSVEFGGFVKWHWYNDDVIVVDDIMIPVQYVGGATIDFESAPPSGYNGVFHKHPTGVKHFSGTDDRYINSNHDISLLFEGGNFITGIINLPLTNGKRYQAALAVVSEGGGKEKKLSVDNIHPLMRKPFTERVVKLPREMIGETFDFEKFFNSVLSRRERK